MIFVPTTRSLVVPSASVTGQAYTKFYGTPKVGLILGSGAPFAGGTAGAGPHFGAFTGTGANQRAMAWASANGLADAKVGGSMSALLSSRRIRASDQATVQELDVTSLDADGFTGNWVLTTGEGNTGGGILGLVGIDNAAVFSVTLPGNTNNFSVTGLGFQPNFVILFGINFSSFDTNITNFGFGWAASPTSQQCLGFADTNLAATSAARRWQRTDLLYRGWHRTSFASPSITLISFDAGGLTLKDSSGSETSTLYGIAMQVPQVYLTTTTSPTTPSTVDVTGCPFAPDLVLAASWCRAASTAIQNDAIFSLGFAAAPPHLTTQHATWVGCRNAQATMETQQVCNSYGLIRQSNWDTGSLALHNSAYLSAFLPNGARFVYGLADAAYETLLCFMGGTKPVVLQGGTLQGGVLL